MRFRVKSRVPLRPRVQIMIHYDLVLYHVAYFKNLPLQIRY